MKLADFLSCMTAIAIICYLWAGWTLWPLKNPLQFSSIPLLFFGKSIHELRRKWKLRKNDAREVNSNDVWIYVFCILFSACFILAISQSEEFIHRQELDNRNDGNNCGNFGGCRTGPDLLPEASVHSVLFSTRWYLDSIKQGVKKEGVDCADSEMIVPRIMKSRYRVPMQKVWTYESIAIRLQCRNESKMSASHPGTPKHISLSHESNPTNLSLIKIQLDNSYMIFEKTCVKVFVEQTFDSIKTEKIRRGKCDHEIRDFYFLNSTRFREALRIAIDNKYIIREYEGYWKILLAAVYNDFSIADSCGIEDMKIYQQIPVYMNKIVLYGLEVVLVLAAASTLIDLYWSELFFHVVENIGRRMNEYILRNQRPAQLNDEEVRLLR